MKKWKHYQAAGYRIVSTATAEGYVRADADPLEAEVKHTRYKDRLYFETHNPHRRGKLLRCYIAKDMCGATGEPCSDCTYSCSSKREVKYEAD